MKPPRQNADGGQIHHDSKVMLLSFTLLKTAAKESPMTIRTCSTFLNSSWVITWALIESVRLKNPRTFCNCKNHQALLMFWPWKDLMRWKKQYFRFRFLQSYQCLYVTFARPKNLHSLPSCTWWPTTYLHENFRAIVLDNADISLSFTRFAYIW